MVALVGLVILLSQVFLAHSLTLVSPHLYKTDAGNLRRNVTRLAKKVEIIDQRVQTGETQLQSVEKKTDQMKDEHANVTRYVDGRLKDSETSVWELKRKLKTVEDKRYIIGGNYFGGRWLWLDGKRADRALFCRGEPHGSGECISVNGMRGYCLDNIKCYKHYGFVCEMPM